MSAYVSTDFLCVYTVYHNSYIENAFPPSCLLKIKASCNQQCNNFKRDKQSIQKLKKNAEMKTTLRIKIKTNSFI